MPTRPRPLPPRNPHPPPPIQPYRQKTAKQSNYPDESARAQARQARVPVQPGTNPWDPTRTFAAPGGNAFDPTRRFTAGGADQIPGYNAPMPSGPYDTLNTPLRKNPPRINPYLPPELTQIFGTLDPYRQYLPPEMTQVMDTLRSPAASDLPAFVGREFGKLGVPRFGAPAVKRGAVRGPANYPGRETGPITARPYQLVEPVAPAAAPEYGGAAYTPDFGPSTGSAAPDYGGYGGYGGGGGGGGYAPREAPPWYYGLISWRF